MNWCDSEFKGSQYTPNITDGVRTTLVSYISKYTSSLLVSQTTCIYKLFTICNEGRPTRFGTTKVIFHKP